MKLRYRDGNQIALLNSGREYFPALLTALQNAQHEIFLETYIFSGDATATAVVERLCAAAARGVRVQVLVDGFGARDMPESYRERLARSGVRLQEYRRPVLWQPVRGLRRMHRKLAVIDGAPSEAAGAGGALAASAVAGDAPAPGALAASAVAFVGGINIIDDWNTPDEVPPRFDYAVAVQGPLVADIRAAAWHLWRVTALARLRAPLVPRQPARRRREAVPVDAATAGGMRAALAVRDNLLHRTAIEDAYLDAIGGARRHILLACGYFLPSRRFFRVLRTAARRGVAVTVLLQGPSDHPLMKAAAQSLYRRLLGSGINVVEYNKSFLHAKVAVIDDSWATVGSSNIDPFSLLLAREANLVVADRAFAQQLRASLEGAIAAGGTRVTSASLAQAGWLARSVQWLAYRFARIVVDLVTPNGARKLA